MKPTFTQPRRRPHPVRVLLIGALAIAMLVPVAAAPASAAPATCNGKAATITGVDGNFIGTEGDDVIVGTSGRNLILGKGGNDTICGMGGIDYIDGGHGNDIIYGHDERGIYSDRPPITTGIYANRSNEVTGRYPKAGQSDIYYLHGSQARIFGPSKSSYNTPSAAEMSAHKAPHWLEIEDLNGGPGNDTIFGSGAIDDIRGDAGNDTMYGGYSGDSLEGGSGYDTFYGGPGNDGCYQVSAAEWSTIKRYRYQSYRTCEFVSDGFMHYAEFAHPFCWIRPR